MQGTWKENLSGYDKKGNKRKKCSRKHTLKDKKYAIHKNKLNIVTDGDVEIIPETKLEYGELAKTYLVSVEKYDWDGEKRSKSRLARTFDDVIWYDEYTLEYIDNTVRKINFEYSEFIEYNEPKKVHVYSEYRFYYSYVSTNTLDFIYGKPYDEGGDIWPNFITRSSKKWYKQHANRKTRSRLKNWLRKKDYDSEIKTHCYEKSIKWHVY